MVDMITAALDVGIMTGIVMLVAFGLTLRWDGPHRGPFEYPLHSRYSQPSSHSSLVTFVHNLPPTHHNFQKDSMNNPSQPPQPAQPDMALLLLGSFFECATTPSSMPWRCRS